MADVQENGSTVCMCCGDSVLPRDPDPWERRLDGYCEDCALARCDAYPGVCTGKVKERDVRPGEIWELRMEPRVTGVQPRVKIFTVRSVEGDDVIFEELLTAYRHDSSRRRHMLKSPDWHRICEAA